MALVSLPFEARAQLSAANPVHLGIAAGVAIPTSTMADAVNTGFNGTIAIGLNPSMIPLGVRIDGAYNQFGAKSGLGGGDFKFTSVTGNLVYKIPGATVSPYAIGGAGWYHSSLDNNAFFGTGSDNHFGWNLGGGISMALSGFNTFIEARYNQVDGDPGTAKFIPITFGVMF